MKSHSPHFHMSMVAAVERMLARPMLRNEAVQALCTPLRKQSFQNEFPSMILGVEARGWDWGVLMAECLTIGFVKVHKAGKSPGECDRASYKLEYGEAVLELKKGTLKPGMTVAVVDDLLATGGTAEATAELVRMQGATVTSFNFLVELGELEGRARLAAKVTGAQINALFTY